MRHYLHRVVSHYFMRGYMIQKYETKNDLAIQVSYAHSKSL